MTNDGDGKCHKVTLNIIISVYLVWRDGPQNEFVLESLTNQFLRDFIVT